jgi:Putative integrase/Integrase repeat unit
LVILKMESSKMKNSNYETYHEAKAATSKLNIKSAADYRQHHKEDLRLPTDPSQVYRDKGWTTWFNFLGKEKISNYETYQEAKAATSKLNVKSSTDYKQNYNKDPRLPSEPSVVYKGKGWTTWFDFLGKEKIFKYKTYEEAKSAVIKMGLSNSTNYRHDHHKDPKLPSEPSIFYKGKGWVSWPDFFNLSKKDFYKTIEEAMSATATLELTTMKEYSKRYSEDPLLPSNPASTYKNNGWVDWRTYLGTNYEIVSYAEAVQLLKQRQIKLSVEYTKLPLRELKLPSFPRKSYKEFYDWASYVGLIYTDPLDALKLISVKGPEVKDEATYLALQALYLSLPENPVTHYGFSSFDDFITFISANLWNAQQVKDYCIEHKIQNRNDYDRVALKTPCLAINIKDIPDFTRIGDLLFKPSYFDVFDSTEHDEWPNIADKWIETISGALPQKKHLIKAFYIKFKDSLPSSPQVACLKGYQFPDINYWLKALSDTSRNISSINLLERFFDFIIEHHCSHRCEDTGELITLEGYWNPITKAEVLVDISGTDSPSETRKRALPFRYINAARQYLIPEHGDKKVGNFRDLYDRLLEKTGLYNNNAEWFEVDEELIGKVDPDCVWKKTADGKYKMWSPVRLMAVYVQLFMPFRGSQICWLDSGEADTKRLVDVDGKFVWQDNSLLSNYRVPAKYYQGFLLPQDSQTGIGAHVNTNKTAKNSCDGYNIPWVDNRIIPWMIRLRDWQTKYNPIEAPSNWTELGRTDKSDNDFAKYGYKGRTCFLFRDPTLPVLQRFRPLTQPKLSDGFIALLYLIQEDELPLARLKKGRKDTSLNNFQAFFTLHSMRVSLITAFIRDAKIAPEIIQKLVGHSSIVMTIYYTKVQAEEIREVLQGAESLIIKNQSKRLEQLIRQRKMEQVTSELIGANGELVGASFDGPAAAFSFMDSGICPFGRTRCEDGGEPINKDRTLFAPVTAGYLGKSNCLQCRHFATGPAFLGGLQLLSNEISLECKASAATMEETRERVEVLEDEQYQAKKANQVFTHSHELSLATSHLEQEELRFDNLTCDLISAIRLFLNSITLLNRKMKGGHSAEKQSLLVQDENNSIEAQVSEVSNFIHMDMVCQSAAFYQSSRPKNASLARTQILDLFAKKNGLSPNIFTLSEPQQLAIGNEMTQMLRARLGTWDKVNQLMDKDSDIGLLDLGINQTEVDDLKILFEGRSLQERQLSAPKPKPKSEPEQKRELVSNYE